MLPVNAQAQTAHLSYAQPVLSTEGVALDSSHHVSIPDGDLSEMKVSTGAVNFGTVAIGHSSAAIPLTFTFDSSGTIGSPVAWTQGAAGLDFAVADTGSCKAGTSYSAGNTCAVDVTFTLS